MQLTGYKVLLNMLRLRALRILQLSNPNLEPSNAIKVETLLHIESGLGFEGY